MIDLKSFVISLPASSLVNLSFQGSLFDAEEIIKLPIAADLRLALDVVLAAYQGTVPLRCVARPEMFTHGVALDWLKDALGGVSNHLNLSDGSTIKLIPKFQNHLFAYGLQSRQRQIAFRKLLLQAPEILAQCDSQINSYYCSEGEAPLSGPFAHSLMKMSVGPHSTNWFYGFYLNPHSVDDSINHMMSWGEFEASKIEQFNKIVYIIVTECSLNDRIFQQYLADAIASAYFDPSECLLIRLPTEIGELMERMRSAVEAIRSTGRRFPRVRGLNVFLLADDLSERSLRSIGSRLHLVLHDTFDYWRYTRPLYQFAGSIVYFFARERDDFSSIGKSLVAESFGRQPTFRAGDRLPEIDVTAG